MLPTIFSYPHFEANQVLTKDHLNRLFDYLDEQERITRSNLIGIGIVCGLNSSFASDGTWIRISKGCGVTSEGYLINWDNDKNLEYFKPYTPPGAVRYPPFLYDHDADSTTDSIPFPMWELVFDRNNDPAARPVSTAFLSGAGMPAGEEDPKILLLFLELLDEDNKNCSRNSCDDKGQTITHTVRPLLIRQRDMNRIQQLVSNLEPSGSAYSDMAASVANRLTLPELRLPRLNVEATSLVTTADIYNAYQKILNRAFLDNVVNAFKEAYQAFMPLLAYSADPFTNLATNWAYLHNNGIINQNLYLGYQYFYDHIDTLIQAYNELRERGLDVIRLCCPDSRLFPRHLMLSKAVPNVNDPAFRHSFIPSPALTNPRGGFSDVRVLFDRLVTLVDGLSVEILAKATDIRITPSQLGAFPLSGKAIPYHYKPDPLLLYWSPVKNRQHKESQNLGYFAPSWNTTDDFVRNPLRYDLEPNNFLRIEGHIGQPVEQVFDKLGELKAQYRLPFNIVAVKTGRSTEAIQLPADEIDCHFQDLEALYGALKEELLCNLCEAVMYFYDVPIKIEHSKPDKETAKTEKAAKLPLLQSHLPDFKYKTGTVGEWYEKSYLFLTQTNYFDINQLNIKDEANRKTLNSLGSILLLALSEAVSSGEIPQIDISTMTAKPNFYLIIYLYYCTKLSESLSEDLSQLNFNDFANKYQDLTVLVRSLNNVLISELSDEKPDTPKDQYINPEELQDKLDHLLFGCKLEPIRSVYQEYQRRLQNLRKLFLFTNYITENPGIQHKAGVPLGGTFIIVYHGEDKIDPKANESTILGSTQKAEIDTLMKQAEEISFQTFQQTRSFNDLGFGEVVITGRVIEETKKPIVRAIVSLSLSNSAKPSTKPVSTLTNEKGEFSITVNRLPANLTISRKGYDPVQYAVQRIARQNPLVITLPKAITRPVTITGLKAGTVVADFYLPYLCCSNCTPIQIIQKPAEPPKPDQPKTEICEYTWISRIGYLTNASRNYRVRIHKYEVNGVSIIGTSKARINIPQADIIQDPLQAIANAFNNFRGLTFGVSSKADGSRTLTIQRPVETHFVIDVEESNFNTGVICRITEEGIKDMKGNFLPYGEKRNCKLA